MWPNRFQSNDAPRCRRAKRVLQAERRFPNDLVVIVHFSDITPIWSGAPDKAPREVPNAFRQADRADLDRRLAEPKPVVDGDPQSGSVRIDQAARGRLGECQFKGPAEIARWASQHLNIEIGLALRSDRWAGADYWEAAADTSLTLDALLARSEVVVMGIDGGGLDDLLGLAVLGRDKTTRQWLLWSRAWANPSVLERRKSEASVLQDFERAGEFVICDQFGDDIAEIAALAKRIDETGLLHAIGLDPFGVGAIVDALAEVRISAAGACARSFARLEAVRRNQDGRAKTRRWNPPSRRSANDGLVSW